MAVIRNLVVKIAAEIEYLLLCKKDINILTFQKMVLFLKSVILRLW